MNIVLFLGAPGSGKGSLSHSLVDKYGFIHLSTGKIFRSKKTEIIKSGAFVSDDDVNKLVLEELNSIYDKNPNAGVILDGYPRTIVQAEFIKNKYPINKVFYLTNVPDDFIIKRLENRLLCEKEDHTFNLLYHPPKVSGICDHDGSKLYKRPDDEREIVKKRLEAYRELTRPLIDFYKQNGGLIELDASKNIEDLIKDLHFLIDSGI